MGRGDRDSLGHALRLEMKKQCLLEQTNEPHTSTSSPRHPINRFPPPPPPAAATRARTASRSRPGRPAVKRATEAA